MLTISILAAIAALVHVLFFAMESLFWMTPAVRKIFRRTEAEAQSNKLMATNQGYYNLFLAVGTIAGICLVNAAHVSEGVAILTVCLGSMVAAAVVLVGSAGMAMLRGALIQGLLPLIALALMWRPI